MILTLQRSSAASVLAFPDVAVKLNDYLTDFELLNFDSELLILRLILFPNHVVTRDETGNHHQTSGRRQQQQPKLLCTTRGVPIVTCPYKHHPGILSEQTEGRLTPDSGSHLPAAGK